MNYLPWIAGRPVHAFHELRDLAAANNVRFLFEAIVMGGALIFSLFREALPAAKLMRFRGILNSTKNLILTEMEQGNSFEAAAQKAQDRTQRRLRRHRRD